jgi:hypothetical protein
MSSTLSAFFKIAAFDDPDQTNAPKLKAVDWNRNTLMGIQIENPSNNRYQIPPLTTKVIFDGTVTLGYGATTEFAVSLSTLSSSLYRITWTAGTDPLFRTARTVALEDGELTLTVLANQTVLVTHEDGAVFGAVQAGDEVFVPGITTGDTAFFNPSNEGKWLVLDATSTQLTLVRETGAVFDGYTQTIEITDNSQFLIFSSAGVQVGNAIVINSGFASALRHSFTINKVTSTLIEFTSSSPLPAQTVIPGVNSFAIYSAAKSFYYLETDQELEVTINSEVENVTPFQAGSKDFPGVKMTSGIVYNMSVTNKASQTANVRIITAE